MASNSSIIAVSNSSSTPNVQQPLLNASTVTPTIPTLLFNATFESNEFTDSGSLIRDGAGAAISAFLIATYTLLGLCICFCLISSGCWCYVKYRNNNKYNNFMSEQPKHADPRPEERDEEP